MALWINDEHDVSGRSISSEPTKPGHAQTGLARMERDELEIIQRRMSVPHESETLCERVQEGFIECHNSTNKAYKESKASNDTGPKNCPNKPCLAFIRPRPPHPKSPQWCVAFVTGCRYLGCTVRCNIKMITLITIRKTKR